MSPESAICLLWPLLRHCRAHLAGSDSLAAPRAARRTAHWIVWRLLRLFVKVIHRARFHGLETCAIKSDPGPLIVVSNHTGAVDPLLIQAGCRFYVSWMMASDMMVPSLNWLWKLEKLIPVARDGRDAAAAREAIRHVRRRRVGIFPEGRIVHPHGKSGPFTQALV